MRRKRQMKTLIERLSQPEIQQVDKEIVRKEGKLVRLIRKKSIN